MRGDFKEYLTQLYQCIPQYIFDIAALVLLIGAILSLLIWGFSKGWRKICFLLLIEYLALIYCSTIVFRRTIENLPVKIIPFDRYEKLLNGTSERIEPELIMNVLVLKLMTKVPNGKLIWTMRKRFFWAKTCLSILMSLVQTR